MLLEAVDLLDGCDLARLEQLGEDERQVCDKRLAIEMGCLSIIASRRALNGDLRVAVAMIEIACELERTGEQAKRVARANCQALDHTLRKPVLSIHQLATQVQIMLSGAIVAFDSRDMAATETVFRQITRVEELYCDAYQQLLDVMDGRPRVQTRPFTWGGPPTLCRGPGSGCWPSASRSSLASSARWKRYPRRRAG
ncbi:MAG: PhoU domain-containing protein [Anaerolineae bacterium]|jgi:phosphate transport system protein